MGRVNRIFFAFILGLGIILLYTPYLFAQEGTSEEFTLEEITVTAEKREVNIQDVPASVVALDGEELTQLGKITIAQILEDVPNVRVTGDSALGITIRGVASHQATPGSGRIPSSTALYVDDVFEGIGGGYDIDRVEALRGPQGTLYGRSAVGGVVATHTKNPKLDEFSGYIIGETGEAELRNMQGAINVPMGDRFALRASGNYLSRGYSYFSTIGGGSKTISGRFKLLYQPSDELKIIFTGTQTNSKSESGGASATMLTPTQIDYEGRMSIITPGFWSENRMILLRADYDFGESNLAYIGSYRTYANNPDKESSYSVQGSQLQKNINSVPGDKIHTEEIRWASDSEGIWTWLIGLNYYDMTYESMADNWQLESYTSPAGLELDPDPNTVGAFIWGSRRIGSITQWGLFTEETFALTEEMRITAGLRYDRTKIFGEETAIFNMNKNIYGNSLKPENIEIFILPDTLRYKDFTFKLRFEYDLTPNNMLYALMSSGFLPGDVRINSKTVVAFNPFRILGVEFSGMPMEKEKMIGYEVGSKNQFLGNRLQVNGSLFYYDYKGYRHVVNVATIGQMPSWATITTPLRMIGAELDTSWLITQQDKVSFNAGYLDAKITEFPVDPLYGSLQSYMVFDRIPNYPPKSANISYDHTFNLANGSFLVPRVSVRWQSGMYLSNLTELQLSIGQAPYAWQDSYMVADIGATWTSPNDMYLISGYIRNITDTEYKSGVSLNTASTVNNGVNVGNPRVWGVSLNIKF